MPNSHRALEAMACGDADDGGAVIRYLGEAAYEPTWLAMQHFTDSRADSTPDELWFVEHPPVFTLGLNASREHVLAPGDIPVVANRSRWSGDLSRSGSAGDLSAAEPAPSGPGM